MTSLAALLLMTYVLLQKMSPTGATPGCGPLDVLRSKTRCDIDCARLAFIPSSGTCTGCEPDGITRITEASVGSHTPAALLCGSSRDCAGLWESDTRARLSNDDCGVCGGDGSSCRDCAGTKGGSAVLDRCSTCVGGTTGLTACTSDCTGIYGGSAVADTCGVCDSDPTNDCDRGACPRQWTDTCNVCDLNPANDCLTVHPKDCAGAGTEGVASTAQSAYDRCNVCITPGVNEAKKDACVDCANIEFGISRLDKCGNCDADKSNDCQIDCKGAPGGSVQLDACGVCGGDGTTCTCDGTGPLEGSTNACSTAVTKSDCDGACTWITNKYTKVEITTPPITAMPTGADLDTLKCGIAISLGAKWSATTCPSCVYFTGPPWTMRVDKVCTCTVGATGGSWEVSTLGGVCPPPPPPTCNSATWAGTETACLESAGTCAGATPDVSGTTTKALCDAAATTAGTFTSSATYVAGP